MTLEPREAAQAIAERIASLRSARGWTAAHLGDLLTKAGVPCDRFAVTKLETGKRQNVTVAELLALAHVFKVPPMFLLGDHPCGICDGSPPQGFTCQSCGTEGRTP